jgi:Flp pilus assembly protein TadG
MFDPTRMKKNHAAGQPCSGRARSRRERGGELVEFSFVLTLLLGLMLGIVVFARGYNVYETITRAAREGAHMASLPTSVYDGNTFIDGSQASVSQGSSTIFTDYIAPALQASNLNPNSVSNYSETIGWLDSGDTDQQCGVTISFQYPYTMRIPFLGAQLGTIPISTHVQMRREDQPAPPTGGGTPTCP